MPTTHPCPAASRHSSTFARDAVFTEFQPRDARRGLDQGAFVDRQPDRHPRRHTEANSNGEIALDQLAIALREVGDDVESQAA